MLTTEAEELNLCFYCAGAGVESSESDFGDRACVACDGKGTWAAVLLVLERSAMRHVALARLNKRIAEAAWTACRFCDGVGFHKTVTDGAVSFDDCGVCNGEHIVPPTSPGWDPARKPWWSDVTADGKHIMVNGALVPWPPRVRDQAPVH